MNCSKHHDREAKGMCVRCNRLICEECAVKINNKYYCKECVTEMYSTDTESNDNRNNNPNNTNYTNESNLVNNNDTNEINNNNNNKVNDSNINEVDNSNTNEEQLDLGKANVNTNVNASDNLYSNSNNNSQDNLYGNSNNNSQENLYTNYQTQQYKNAPVKTYGKYKEAKYVLAIIAIALLIPRVILAINGFEDCFENMYLSIRYDDGFRAVFFFINSLLTLLEPLIVIALATLTFKNFMKLKKVIRIIAPIVVVAVFTILIFITGNIALRFIYLSPLLSMVSYIIPVALIIISNCLDKE